MRIWNGLRVNDIVIYNNKKYIIIKLYAKEDKRLCDLALLHNLEKDIIKGILVHQCIKYVE